MDNNILTVFTPAYNRGYTLDRLYSSLLRQSCKRFEWLIVDDGSTDNTAELIKDWQKEGKVDIRYIYEENSGKSVAHNVGVANTKTPLFTCVDSDDYLTDDAVEVICELWQNKLPANCIGFVGFIADADGKVLTYFPHEKENMDTLKGFYRRGLKGDTILIYRTDIINKYQFPKFDGEKFVPESYLYDLLDQEGKMFLLRKALYVYEYLPDGYTANMRRLIKKNPHGYLAYICQRIKIEKFSIDKIKDVLRYVAVAKCCYGGIRDVVCNSPSPQLTLIVYPIGVYVHNKLYRDVK